VFIVSVIVYSNCHILQFLHQMFIVSALFLDHELDMGPFLLTQSNPIYQLMDPIQSKP